MIANRMITWFINFINRFMDFHDFATGLIVIIAVSSFTYFLIINRRMNNGIMALTKIVENLEGTTDEKMVVLNDTIKQSNNKVIKVLWQKYYKTLIKYGGEGTSIDISTFFNKVTLVDIPTQRKIAEIFPGILIATGILGTFTGLVVGLNSIDVKDTEAIQASMLPLMGGLKIGFLTSVLGIGSSLLWNFFDRVLLHRIVKGVIDFQVAYEQTFPSESLGSYLIEMIKMQDAQTAAVREMSSNIGTNEPKQSNEYIGDQLFSKMANAISIAITNSISPLVQAVATLNDKVSNISSADSFTSSQPENKGAENARLNDVDSEKLINTIEETINNVSDLQTQIYDNVNRLSGNVEDLTVKVEDSIKNAVNSSMGGMNQDIMNSVKELSDKIHESIKETFDDQMKTVTLHIEETVNNVNTTVEKTAREFDDLKESLKNVDSKLGDKVIYGAKTKRSDGNFY